MEEPKNDKAIEYIYIFSNEKYPGLLKIGRTNNKPDVRAHHLSKQTGAIGEFKMVWSKEVDDSVYYEFIIHHLLKEFHSEKEYFKISEDEAILACEKIIREIELANAKVQAQLRKLRLAKLYK